MKYSFLDKSLYEINDKVVSGERLGFEDGIALYKSNDLIGVGHLADYVRRKLHGKKAFYVYNQHLNFTNICLNRCLFCAFSRDDGEKDAFALSIDDVRSRLMERINEPVRELHVVGGLNSSLSFDYYIELLNTIKEVRPEEESEFLREIEFL
ncbi:MAG: hypothetical protein LWX02_08495 [Deltaproteobacteria bacterium]|jgi:aminodeoxyfutalosine synthase|nr:hypothetical protein [Deltaproteobacteria bacterium]